MKSFIKQIRFNHNMSKGIKNIFLMKFFLAFFLILSISNVVLADETNLTAEQKSIVCIQSSKNILDELNAEGFSVVRINDTIKEAEIVLEIQQAQAAKGRSTDYSRVLALCEEVSQLRTFAFDMRDQINVLKDFFEASSQGINTSEIDVLFLELEKEMENERYELIPDLIERTYDEISLAQSKATTLNVFYDATTRGIKRFFRERWLELLIGLIILAVLISIFKKPVQRKLLNRSLARVELRKKSLKDMIMENQDLYFNKGKISESVFTIKNKKLAELVRDMDRQISILKERLYALDHKQKPIKEKKKK